jgi:hypothetical protein
VIRRPTGLLSFTDNIIQLREVQVWVNGSNILFPNSATLTSYFAEWNIDKNEDVGGNVDFPTQDLYNMFLKK